jgi:hypothetical protein
MAKDSMFVSPATPLSTPSTKTSASVITNGEPGMAKRSKTQGRLDTINRVVNSRLPQPTKK